MPDSGRKRRNILIDTRLQVGLTLHVLGWLSFYIVLFAGAVNGPAVWTWMTAAHSDPAYFDAVERLQWFARSTLLPLSVMFVGVAAHGVVFAHRIAGPIHRIETVLRDLAGRKFQTTPVKLRPKDFFKNLATTLTTAIAALRADAARGRRMNQETIRGLRELLEAVEKGRVEQRGLIVLTQKAIENAEQFDRHLAAAASDDVDASEPTEQQRPAVAVGVPAAA
jgi:hypothetical protein